MSEREEIIEIMQVALEEHYAVATDYRYWLRTVIAALNSAGYTVSRTPAPSGEWISCAERMPPPADEDTDEGTTYAVIKVNRHGARCKDAARWQPDTGYERSWQPDPRPAYTVTHWAPLPPLPAAPQPHGEGEM